MARYTPLALRLAAIAAFVLVLAAPFRWTGVVTPSLTLGAGDPTPRSLPAPNPPKYRRIPRRRLGAPASYVGGRVIARCSCSTPSPSGCWSAASPEVESAISSASSSRGGVSRSVASSSSSCSSRTGRRADRCGRTRDLRLSTLAVLAALMRNLEQPGFTLIAIGGVANLIAILANGGAMPSESIRLARIDRQGRVPVQASRTPS